MRPPGRLRGARQESAPHVTVPDPDNPSKILLGRVVAVTDLAKDQRTSGGLGVPTGLTHGPGHLDTEVVATEGRT